MSSGPSVDDGEVASPLIGLEVQHCEIEPKLHVADNVSIEEGFTRLAWGNHLARLAGRNVAQTLATGGKIKGCVNGEKAV
jgi:hypothetical protein